MTNNNVAKPELTASRLRKTLSYSKATGLFRWLVRHSNRVRVGDIAGDANHVGGARRIGIFGRSYLAHHLAVLYVTGRWPANNVAFRNGIRSDCRWRNLRVV
jgi:HNH endonuclease